MPTTRHLKSQAGLSLLEVVVTALMVMLMAGGTATALITTTRATGDQRLRAEASALAAEDQDRLRGLSDEQLTELDSASAQRTQTVNGTTFTIRSSATFANVAGASSCATSQAAEFQITSNVTWAEGYNTASHGVSISSQLARPTTGDLMANANDQAGNPLSGVQVTGAGPSNATAYGNTDSAGCTLFAGLSSGSWTLTATDTGYVAPNGSSAPTLSTTVTALGTPSANTFSLGQAGTINATITTASGVTAQADGLSWSGAGASQTMNAPNDATSATPTSSYTTGASLYPFDMAASGATPSYSGNYAVWAGRCPQQKPASPTAATVTPGSVQSLNVPEPQLNVNSITYPTTGTSTAPTTLVLSFASNTGTACTDRWTVNAAIGSGTGNMTVPTTGWLSVPGEPYADGTSGTLTVCANYTNTVSTTSHGHTTTVTSNYHSSNTTTNTNFSSPTAVALTTSASGTC